MKLKLTTCGLVILLATGTNCYAQNQKTKVKTTERNTQSGRTADEQNQGSSTTRNDVSLPYTARYSSQFKTTGVKYSPIVFNVWKSYDTNSFDGMSAHLADTVMAILLPVQ